MTSKAEIHTRRNEFLAGVKDTFPLVAAAAPFGLIFGTLAVTSGISPAATIGMSLFVYAGSAQFIAAGLVAQGVGGAFIVLTTFVVNLRHALYAASLAPYMKYLSQKWLLPLGFWLTDETYAVTITRYPRDDGSPYKHWYYLGSAIFMYINWQCWTVAGIVAGTQLEGIAELGLDFALIVTFIGIVVPLIVNRPVLVCVLVAGGSSLLFNGMPNKLGLMVGSLLGIAAGLVAELMMSSKKKKRKNA